MQGKIGSRGSRVGPHVGTASVHLIVGIATSDRSQNWICATRRMKRRLSMGQLLLVSCLLVSYEHLFD